MTVVWGKLIDMQFRTRVALASAAGLAVIGVVALVYWIIGFGQGSGPADARSSPDAVTASADSPVPTWSPSKPTEPVGVRLSWAYVESIEGTVSSGGNTDAHELDGLATAAIVQDYLANDATPDQDATSKLAAALRGDQDAAAWVTEQRGGRDAAVARTITACSLTGAATESVRATELAVARLGACLREGEVVEPKWSTWMLNQMRSTTGGIGDARGSDTGQDLAQQNSTVLDGDRYRTGCMAIGAYWSAGVLLEYPTELGAAYGPLVCADVARTAFPPDTQQVPDDEPPAPVSSASARDT